MLSLTLHLRHAFRKFVGVGFLGDLRRRRTRLRAHNLRKRRDTSVDVSCLRAIFRTSLASIGRDRSILIREVVARNSLDIFGRHRIDALRSIVDFLPGSESLVTSQLLQQKEVALEATEIGSRELVLHLLQFVGGHGLVLDLLELRVPRLLEIARIGVAFHLGEEAECARVFARIKLRTCVSRNFRALDQRLVESAGAPIEHRRHDLERVRIAMTKRHRVVTHLDRRLAVALGVEPHLRHLFNFKRDHGRRRLLATLEAAEIAANRFLHFARVEVADHHAAQIVGAVVDVEVLHRLLHRVTVEIARPSDHRPRVSTRRVEHRVELLLEDSRRRAFGAQAALLVHDIALGKKLAEHGVGEAIGLHPRPEFELVARNIDEVEGQVVRGVSVHPRAALRGVDLVELILDDAARLVLLRLHHVGLAQQPFLRFASRGGSVLLKFGDLVAPEASLLRVHERLQLGAELRQLRRIVFGCPGVADFALEVALVLTAPGDRVHSRPQRLLLRAILGVGGGV